MLISQIILGIISGILIGKITVYLLNRLTTQLNQATTILVVAAVLIAYALPTMINGNGYLSVYLCGIIMGNSEIPEKRSQVHFFDTLTGIAQMMIFVNDCYKVAKSDYIDAKNILNWNPSTSLVSGSALNERMNEYKTHTNWAKKILHLAEYYGTY